MKKSILVLLVGLLSITSSFGQTRKDSLNTYNKLKNWAVVKLTIAYIEDLKGWSENTHDGQSKNEFETYKILSTKYSIFNDSIEVNLDSIALILEKGSWSDTKKKVFDKYKLELVDSNNGIIEFNKVRIFRNKLPSSDKSSSTLIEIQNKYNLLLPHEEEQDNISIAEEVENKSVIHKAIGPAKKTPQNRALPQKSIIMFIFFVLLIIFTIIIFFQNKNSKKKIKYLKNELRESKNTRLDQESRTSVNNKELTQVKDQLNILENKLKRCNDERELAQKAVVENESIKQVDVENTIPVQASQSIIYLPRPQEEKLFLKKHAKDYIKDNYIYEVTFNHNDSSGSLSLIESADLSRALSSPERYLEKACIYDNEYSNNSQGVRVIEKGEIKQEGEDWIVTKKVRIKFI